MQTAGREAIESPYAWTRLWMSLLLMTIGGSGMYAVTVVLPHMQRDFGIARGAASLPYTLTMIGFGVGGIVMGRLADRFGVMVPVMITAPSVMWKQMRGFGDWAGGLFRGRSKPEAAAAGFDGMAVEIPDDADGAKRYIVSKEAGLGDNKNKDDRRDAAE